MKRWDRHELLAAGTVAFALFGAWLVGVLDGLRWAKRAHDEEQLAKAAVELETL